MALDYLTKWTGASAARRCNKQVASDFIYHQIVRRYGCPLEIVTDQGSHFVNKLVSELLLKMSVKHQRVSPYYPQANGLVEKTNGILIGRITKVVIDARKKWDNYVNDALWAYQTAYKLTTSYTPF